MNIPPQNDRLEIWRYTYARSSLVDAIVGCEKLRSDHALAPDMKKAVVSHIVISYARPFTKSQFTASRREVPLQESCVPSEKKAIHDTLLEMRNRALGHKDATAFSDTALNRVLVRAHDGYIDLHTVFPGDIEQAVLSQTIELCRILIAHCEKAVDPFVRAHLLGANRPVDGSYLVSTEETPPIWLAKAE